jgi:hypothetical protein
MPRPGQRFAQATIIIAVPGEAQALAEIGAAFLAELAPPTGNCRVYCYPGTICVDSSELVAQDQWMCQAGISNRAILEPVHIRAANPHGFYPHERLLRSTGRYVFLVQPEISCTVQPANFHPFLLEDQRSAFRILRNAR